MQGRMRLLATVIVCVGGLTVAASSAGASANVLGVGSPNCAGAWTGVLRFMPALRTAGTATTEEIEIQAVAKPCSFGTPVPTKGTIIGKGVVQGPGANSCAVFTNPPPGNVVVPFSTNFFEHVTWTPAAIVGTSVNFPSVTVRTTALNQPVQFRSPTTPVVAGSSYAPTVTQKLLTVKTLAVILSAAAGDCGNATGVTNLVIRPAGTAGVF